MIKFHLFKSSPLRALALGGMACLPILLITGAAAQARTLDQAYADLGAHWDALGTSAQNSLLSGQPVIQTEYTRSAGTPEVFVFETINATPEQVMAVLTDYPRYPQYFNTPQIKECSIQSQPTPLDTWMHYKLEIIPIILYESYTVSNLLSTYASPGSAPNAPADSYRLDRNLEQSQNLRALQGVARVEPFAGRTRIEYFGYVETPINVGESRAVADVRWVIDALVGQVNREKQGDLALLQQQVGALRAAIARGAPAPAGN